MHTPDLIGVFASAVSGARMAIGRDCDLVGIAILAVVTALGGVLRDVLAGETPARPVVRQAVLSWWVSAESTPAA